MCEITINEGNKTLRIAIRTKNFSNIEIEKTKEAFKQFLLKAKEPKRKFERRVKRILKESEK